MAFHLLRGIYLKYVLIVLCLFGFCAILAIYNSKENIYGAFDELSDYFGTTRNVVIYDNVCIEQDGKSKILVVYNSKSNRKQKIKVGGGFHQQDKTWILHFRNIAIPETHTRLDAHAYFIKYTCDGNLHHFWTDTFDGLYGALKRANDYIGGRKMNSFYALSNGGRCLYLLVNIRYPTFRKFRKRNLDHNVNNNPFMVMLCLFLMFDRILRKPEKSQNIQSNVRLIYAFILLFSRYKIPYST